MGADATTGVWYQCCCLVVLESRHKEVTLARVSRCRGDPPEPWATKEFPSQELTPLRDITAVALLSSFGSSPKFSRRVTWAVSYRGDSVARADTSTEVGINAAA